MDKETRNDIREATEAARKLLTEDFAEQLLADFNVHSDGRIDAKPRAPELTGQHAKIIAAIQHKRAAGFSAADAVADYLRDAAFTTLNRFVALKMLEARELVQQCVSKGEESSGYGEFCGLMPGLRLLPNRAGYRLYIESLFDELSTEVKVLFDRRDPAAVLWPRRPAFDQLLILLNDTKLASVWGEDETIGWVYQFFNSKEERAAMRDTKQSGSQAPRNGRELAVRNQFFTPRYVVQFLTDNTLGRLWYEMRGSLTSLGHRCEYLAREPDTLLAIRERKDPRDLRVLDPACGSGHFLLYAFDLLVCIYEEAHADPHGPVSEITGQTLSADYPDVGTLRRAIPALILAHNLYGVDIDARCTQIAQLALWMRAQRAFLDFGVSRDQRSRIRRSNIVVAEPLVADATTLSEFLPGLNDTELERVFVSLIDTLGLAGDLGLLLRLEALMKPLLPHHQTGALFAPTEARLRSALLDFVDRSAATNIQRQLFVDDAAHGIGLLEACERRYDVVLMNPPFGLFTSRSLYQAKDQYPTASNEIYAAFVLRALELTNDFGFVGVLSSRLGFFLDGLDEWRQQILQERSGVALILDLGYGVLDDALVEAAAYVIRRQIESPSVIAFRLLDERDKQRRAGELLKSFREGDAPAKELFVRDRAALALTPGQILAYWLPTGLLRLFSDHQNLGSDGVVAYSGLQTDDDFRFVRLWWEVDVTEGNWPPFAKGGEYLPYADDLHLVVRWADDGAEMKAFVEKKYKQWSRHIKNTDRYFRNGLTYTERTTSDISVRPIARNAIFSVSGPSIQADDSLDLQLAWGMLCTRVGRALMDTLVGSGDTSKAGTAARHYRTRLVASLPSAKNVLSAGDRDFVINGTLALWKMNLRLRVRSETHRLFSGLDFSKELRNLGDVCKDILIRDAVEFVAASETSASIDRLVASAFGLNDLDGLINFAGPHPFDLRNQRSEDIDGAGIMLSRIFAGTDEALTQLAVQSGVPGRAATKRSFYYSRELELACLIGRVQPSALPDLLMTLDTNILARQRRNKAFEIISIAMGVVFGRWNEEVVLGGLGNISKEAEDPFCALSSMPPTYSSTRRPREVIVDDAGSTADLELLLSTHLRSFANADLIGDLEVELQRELRVVVRSDFFSYHLSKYSNSRRRAPIYWQLATPSASYSVWLYIHAFNRDTLFRVQNDYAATKLRHEERKLESLRLEHGTNTGPAERRAIADQETFVDELRGFLEEVRRVTPLWNPNLDDGVLLNFAPLWRLVPQNRAWQKELKAAWDGLCNAEYDWAHLAMHLWPERVVPKCATDRSLAIAHGLEAVFWVQGADGKWTSRATPTRPIAELVQERSSPAVKAALISLLEAPVQSGATRKPRKGKANA